MYDYIRNRCLHYIDELELVLCHSRLWLLHDEYHPTQLSLLIHCLRDVHILIFAKLLSFLLLLQLLQNCYCYFCHRYRYFHITLLLNTFLQILSLSGVVKLTTQLLIIENILWLPLCRIDKFGLNTLPSKTVVIPYTCGLSGALAFI